MSKTTESLCDLIRARAELGAQKYGATLDRTDLTAQDWAQHAIEEALDFAGYLQCLKRALSEQSALIARLESENTRLRAVLLPLAALAEEALAPVAIPTPEPETSATDLPDCAPNDYFMTYTEAAEVLGVSADTVRLYAQQGKIVRGELEREYWVTRPSVLTYIERREEGKRVNSQLVPKIKKTIPCAGPLAVAGTPCPHNRTVSKEGCRCFSCSAKVRVATHGMPKTRAAAKAPETITKALETITKAPKAAEPAAGVSSAPQPVQEKPQPALGKLQPVLETAENTLWGNSEGWSELLKAAMSRRWPTALIGAHPSTMEMVATDRGPLPAGYVMVATVEFLDGKFVASIPTTCREVHKAIAESIKSAVMRPKTGGAR